MANQVVDMEWSFGVTAANSEVAQVGNTFVHLKLMIDKGDGKVEAVPMELSVEQFYQFIQDMEKAKHIMNILRTG